jgi:hypothetical protein
MATDTGCDWLGNDTFTGVGIWLALAGLDNPATSMTVRESVSGLTEARTASSSVMSMGVDRLGFDRAPTEPVEPVLEVDEVLLVDEVELVLALPVDVPFEALDFPVVPLLLLELLLFPELPFPVVPVELVDEVEPVTEVIELAVLDVELVLLVLVLEVEPVPEVLPVFDVLERLDEELVELAATEPDPATDPAEAEEDEAVVVEPVAALLDVEPAAVAVDEEWVALVEDAAVAETAADEVPVFLAPQPASNASATIPADT